MKTAAVIILIVLMTTAAFITWFHRHPCLKYENQYVHHPAWTQMMIVGKIFVPIYHDSYDDWEDVCIIRK